MYPLLYTENRTHFFKRTVENLGLAVSTHPTYRFVVVVIMAGQLVKHAPFDTYRNMQLHPEDNKQPVAQLPHYPSHPAQ